MAKACIQEVSLILTYDCTRSCSMCLQRMPFREEFRKRFPNRMSLQNWCSVIDQLEGYCDSIQYIYLTGGEPFLEPYVFELVRYIKGKHFICSANSNGSQIKKHLNELFESGLDLLILSLDGPKAIHDKIRNRAGSYTEIVDVIREIRKHRSWLKPRIFVNCTVQEHNYHHLAEWAREMVDIGADQVYFHLQMFISKSAGERYCRQYLDRFGITPFSHKGAIANPSVNTHKLMDILTEIKKKHHNIHMLHDLQKVDLNVYFNDPDKAFRRPEMQSCCAAQNILEIAPDGSVITCHDFPDYVAGNVREQTVGAIWEGEKMNVFRQLVGNKRLFSICHRCCMSERYASYANGTTKQTGAFHEETTNFNKN